MMLPAETISPPQTFTPSRLPSESRPFLDDPPPFLCAIFLYLQDLDPGPCLTVPSLLSAVLLRPVLVDVDLLALQVLEDLHLGRPVRVQIEVVAVGQERDRQLH